MTTRVLDVLRSREPIAAACAAVGVSVDEFRRERAAYLRGKLPPAEERVSAAVGQAVEVLRDRWGIPHVRAGSERDALLAFGYCMGRDRLWQLDYLRREALGRLAELLGTEAHASDLRMRTVGIPEIATAEVERVDSATRELVEGFVAGINRAIEAAGRSLPIEFDLLGYEPEPWTLRDSIGLLRGLWWQLTGRLENIVAAETAARHLDEARCAAFLTPELPDERILGRELPYPGAAIPVDQGPPPLGSGDATGSNNWAIAGSRTTTGAALLAADPHLPFVHPSDFYEAQLTWPGGNVVGAHWVGVPGANWGYNGSIAWGLTNNVSSPRDLYVETVNPVNADEYRRGGRWVPFRKRTVEIAVRGEAARRHELRATDLGPIVNAVTPSVAEGGDPPLSLRWTGAEHLDDLKAMLGVSRATDFASFHAALGDWSLPVWNWVCADRHGQVGYQSAGRVPLRGRAVRGYREAEDLADQWCGYVPYEAMPKVERPSKGFIATANNRPVPDDYPYPLYGAFAGGNRAMRIRQRIEAAERVSAVASRDLQNDVYLIRAARMAPPIARALRSSGDADLTGLAGLLEGWDHRYTLESAAPTAFEAIAHFWADRVGAARFPRRLLGLVNTSSVALGARLLEGEPIDWFPVGVTVEAEVVAAARSALGWLRARFGADPAGWAWGRAHTMTFVHPLSGAFGPAFAEVADLGPAPVPGSADSVRNAAGSFEHGFQVVSGAEYRLLVDFAASPPAMATNTLGQSGQPGSAHYADQLDDWVNGTYHPLLVDRAAIQREMRGRVTIECVQ